MNQASPSIFPAFLSIAGAYMVGVYVLGYGLPSQMPGGLPIHLVFLLLGLLGAIYHFRQTPILVFVIPFMLFSASLIRWTFGLGGFYALRDMSPSIDALWLIVGYAAGASGIGVWLISHWPLVTAWSMGYWLLYPFSPMLMDVPPAWGLHDNGLFGHMRAHNVIPVIAGAVILWQETLSRRLILWLLGGSLVVAVMTMSRICLISTSFALLWLGFQGRIRLPLVYLTIATLATLFVVLPLLGLTLETRYGDLGGTLVVQAAQSTYGGGELAGASGGLGQRVGWWINAIETTLQTDGGSIWGRGYGIILTDHVVGEVATRELHNSWISMFCRLGLIGLGLLSWLVLFVIQHLQEGGSPQGRLLMPIVLVTFGLLTCFEPALENSDFAALLWFAAGAIMARTAQRRPGLGSPKDAALP